METALPPAPRSSYLLPLIIALVFVSAGSLYYYLRVTSPALFTSFDSSLSNLQSTINDLRSSAPAPTPAPSSTDSLQLASPPGGSPTPTPDSARTAPKPGKAESSTPLYPIPTGLQTYRFSHGKDVKGPKIQTAVIDPLDPRVGSTQKITLELESDSPVTSAAIIIATDNRAKTLNLALTGGNSSKGTYSGSWEVDDSYNKMYAIRYILKSASGTYDNTMYLRQ